MLWPEGSATIVADLGSFLNPPSEERVVGISVSKAGSFVAISSKRVLALFRLRPLIPLAIYPELFPDTEITDICTSSGGDCLAVLTSDNRVVIFSIKPTEDIEEVLKLSCIVTPGPGEAIGARELWLEPLNTLYVDGKVVFSASAGPLLIVCTETEIQVVYWEEFQSDDRLNMPHFRRYSPELAGSTICSGTCAKISALEWIICVVTHNGTSLALKCSTEISAAFDPVEINPISVGDKIKYVDFNMRMHKLALVSEKGKTFVINDMFDPEIKFLELPWDGQRQPLTIKWSPTGTSLLIGYVDGWQLMSMLGLSLYNYREKLGDSSIHGEMKVEWMLNAESVLFLGTDGKVRLQNMLKWSGFCGSSRCRPVLHGNGRLMLYHDPAVRGVINGYGSSNQSWLTIPLPTWYMAQNWPIAHIASSPDGRFVAVAGNIGIMLFSVITRQWKEIGDRESMVRGGLCWHGRQLVAATVSAIDDTVSLKLFSSISGHKNNSSSNLLGHLWPGKVANVRSPDLSTQSDMNSPQDRNSHPGTHNSLLNNFTSTQSRRHSAQDLLNGLQSPASSSTGLATAFSSSLNISGLGTSTSEQQVVAKDILGKNNACHVSYMSKGPQGLLGVLVGTDIQQLLIYDLSYLEFELIRSISITKLLEGIYSIPVVRSFHILSEGQVLVLVGTTLIFISSVDSNGKMYHRQIVAEPIESFDYIASEEQLWIFDGQDAIVTNWSANNSIFSDNLGSSNNENNSKESDITVHSTEPEDYANVDSENNSNMKTSSSQTKYLATISLDAYPIYFSSNSGVISLIEAEPMPSFDSSFTIARPTTIHEVYIHYIVQNALVPAYDAALKVIRKYAKTSYFSGILETLLYRVVTNEDDEQNVREEALRLAVKLVREFPAQNFEAIIAGCARKVETKYWTNLFKAVGKTPAELFDFCLDTSDLETASEFLIVVQASSNQGTPEPGNNVRICGLNLEGRILKLYKVAAAARKFWICKQLCEFLMALDPSGTSLREFSKLIGP